MKFHQTNHQEDPLQQALLKVSKVGNFTLMQEFIACGADPFAPDSQNHNAIFYAKLQDPIKTGNLLMELDATCDKYKAVDDE